MPYIPIPDPCFNTPTPPPPFLTPPPPPSPLRRYLCHWFWHLMYVSNVCILAFLIRNRLSRIILAFVVSLLIFRIVPMSKLLNTSHRASVRLFMWHVYFWLSFSLFHWYSNCPLHHTSCLTLDIFFYLNLDNLEISQLARYVFYDPPNEVGGSLCFCFVRPASVRPEGKKNMV